MLRLKSRWEIEIETWTKMTHYIEIWSSYLQILVFEIDSLESYIEGGKKLGR